MAASWILTLSCLAIQHATTHSYQCSISPVLRISITRPPIFCSGVLWPLLPDALQLSPCSFKGFLVALPIYFGSISERLLTLSLWSKALRYSVPGRFQPAVVVPIQGRFSSAACFRPVHRLDFIARNLPKILLESQQGSVLPSLQSGCGLGRLAMWLLEGEFMSTHDLSSSTAKPSPVSTLAPGSLCAYNQTSGKTILVISPLCFTSDYGLSN